MYPIGWFNTFSCGIRHIPKVITNWRVSLLEKKRFVISGRMLRT